MNGLVFSSERTSFSYKYIYDFKFFFCRSPAKDNKHAQQVLISGAVTKVNIKHMNVYYVSKFREDAMVFACILFLLSFIFYMK